MLTFEFPIQGLYSIFHYNHYWCSKNILYFINLVQFWIPTVLLLDTVLGTKIWVQLVYLRGNSRKHWSGKRSFKRFHFQASHHRRWLELDPTWESESLCRRWASLFLQFHQSLSEAFPQGMLATWPFWLSGKWTKPIPEARETLKEKNCRCWLL